MSGRAAQASIGGAPAPRVPAETLPEPKLSAEPATLRPAPGALVQLRCRAPRPGLRFALEREDRGWRRVVGLQSPAGAEARFELRDVTPLDSANYSCVYADTAPPFAGSAPSARLELQVDGERTEPASPAGFAPARASVSLSSRQPRPPGPLFWAARGLRVPPISSPRPPGAEACGAQGPRSAPQGPPLPLGAPPFPSPGPERPERGPREPQARARERGDEGTHG